MIELIKVEYICHKCIKTVSEIILIQVPISFQAVHLHSSPYKKRKHWIKSEENKKKSIYSKCRGFRHGRYGTSNVCKAKKMDLQRRAAQSLQIRVLTVVSATDELFIKLLQLTLHFDIGRGHRIC